MKNEENYLVYVLQSTKNGRLYIGYTQDIERRLEEHNSGHTSSTRNKGPWMLLIAKKITSRLEAVRLEKQLKSWKNRQRVLSWIERENDHFGV